MIRKVVIPAAGLGTRLLSATKEQPKEMLPVFCRSTNGDLSVKPLVQLVFEQLFDAGIREFCFVVGRGKRAIEDHFIPDFEYVNRLNSIGKNSQASDLESFYRKLGKSTIIWVNQPQPKGFGHAVLLTKPFIGNEPFLVCAGDTYIISQNGNHIKRLIEAHHKYKSDATLLLQYMKDPKGHGIAEAKETKDGVFKVKSVVEKPEKPPSNLAIMPIYMFNPTIMNALEKTPPGYGGEIQLTDGIQKLIDLSSRVYAAKLRKDEIRLDIGTPESYWEALNLSYKYFKSQC